MSAYFPELVESFTDLFEALKDKRVCVIGHARPDGDCIGSQVALVRMLQNQGIDAFAANADIPPEPLKFLSEETQIEVVDIEKLNEATLVYVDCADERRVGPKTSQSLEPNEKFANIDHHISNTEFAERNLIDAQAAATCEILAGLAFDLKIEVDAVTAQALYTGILTDTGRFSYEGTSGRVFDICSRLVASGASPQRSSQILYENEKLPRLKLLQRFLDSLTLECDGRVCAGMLRQRDFIETGTAYEDTEGFVDYARSVGQVDIGVMLEERKTTTKCSLRAKDAKYRVDMVASKFGGGGHACAAGLSSSIPFSDLRGALMHELEERLNGDGHLAK